MKVPEVYECILDEEWDPAPSIMVGALPAGTPEPTVAGMQAQLREAGLDIVEIEVMSRPQGEGCVWRQMVTLRLEGREDPLKFDVWLESTIPSLLDMMTNDLITEAEKEEAAASEWSLGVSTQLGPEPLWDYHRQLQVLTKVAPEAVVVIDPSSTWVAPATWVRDVAAASVPPSGESMYRLHAVSDDETGANGWIHSHGLLRCGLVELEIVDVPPNTTGAMGELLNGVASVLMDLGMPPPGETFAIGGGLELVWLPWEVGIKHAPRGMWSQEEDRQDGHFLPSGILFTPPKGLLWKRYGSPVKYVRHLEDNPVLWISTGETERMSTLARERFERFAALQAKHGADGENWSFLVKLGLPIDEAQGPEDREHLWFQVHAITDDQVDATLLNQPYGIASLHEGDHGPRSLDHMSDWAVICEHGRFDPDVIFHLERMLESGAGAAGPEDAGC